jgi:hypothetical protein
MGPFDQTQVKGVALTPSAFLQAVATRLDRLHEGGGVVLRAVPVRTFGAWLRGCLEEKQVRARQVKESEGMAHSRDLLGQLAKFQAVQSSLAWWRAAAVILLALWTGALIWFILFR